MTRERGGRTKPRELMLPEALAVALELHKDGHFDEAEALYRKILAAKSASVKCVLISDLWY